MAMKFIPVLKDGKTVLLKVPSKGDRIMFPCNGETIHAVVTKVSTKTFKATARTEEMEYTVPFGVIKPSNKPIEKDPPNPMDSYELRKYKEVAGHDDTQPFQAEIWKDGKMILIASNDGWGGSNNYQGNPEVFSQFHKDAEAWELQFGIKKPFEPAGNWISWYAYCRPVGTTAAQYCKKYQNEMDKFMGPELCNDPTPCAECVNGIDCPKKTVTSSR